MPDIDNTSLDSHHLGSSIFQSELLSVLKARYQLETTAEMVIFQRLVLPLNKRIEASSWCLNERLTQVL